MFEADPFSKETSTKGEKIMEHVSKERQKTWHSLISTEMSRNSKKAWSTFGKLRKDSKVSLCQPIVTTNQTANQIVLEWQEWKQSTKTKLNARSTEVQQ